jgi:predicted secreted Zn-dependent protease
MCSIILRDLFSNLDITVPYCDCMRVSVANINHFNINSMLEQEESFHRQNRRNFKEDISKILYFWHNFK